MRFFLILFLAVFNNLSAQIVSYTFENNLNDNISGQNGSFTVNGLNNNNPIFTTGKSGKGVSLDYDEGIKFPISINNSLLFDKSIEFIFDFKITDLGDGQGRKEILELSAGWNDNTAGINVFSTKIDNNNYRITLNYTDGGYNAGVENHPGGSRNNIGTFEINEFINFRLILDFEKNKWFTILNNTSSSAFFDDYYDLNKMKKAFKENNIRVGWLNSGIEWVMNNHPEIYTAKMVLDNFEIYSPRSIPDVSEFTTALTALTKHVKQTEIINETQLANYLNDIQLNYSGNFEYAKSEILEFINAYEDRYEPVFADGNQAVFSSLPIVTQALIFLQQSIFDEEYKTDYESLDGLKFEFSEVFPGKVNDSAIRVNDENVEIDGTYNLIHGSRHLHDTWPAKRPTGYYAAPGELVTITIPSNYIDKGLSVMVGAHERDHSNLSATNRFLRVSNKFNLDKAETKIINPFGGGIYFLVPEGSNLGYFNIKITGAVKSPYFSTREGKETDPSIWQAELAQQNVKWVDIESDKFMTTLPTKVLDGISPGSINLSDPTLMMKRWDEVADGFNYTGGRPYERSRAEYIISDTRIPDGGYGTGYPAVYDDDDLGMMAIALLRNDPHKIGGVVTMFHEMGHLEWHPTLGNAVESIVHLPAVYIWNKYYDQPLDTAFKYSAFQKLTMDQTTIDWIITDNFRNNVEISCDPTMAPNVCHEVRYQHRGHAIYIEMADLFGWEAVYKTHKVFYDEWKVNTDRNWGFMSYNNGNGVSDDELILAASNANNVNMAPLFHFWGRHASEGLLNQLKNLPESNEIYCRLQYYKSMAPTDQSSFQQWYDSNYGPVGDVQQVRYDYAIINFDKDEYGSAIQQQIDLIINKHFSSQIDCFNEPLGIENVSSEDKMIFPNPVEDKLNIDLTSFNHKNVIIKIYDFSGRLVDSYNSKGGKIFIINTNNYQKGNYLLNIRQRKKIVSRQFIKND